VAACRAISLSSGLRSKLGPHSHCRASWAAFGFPFLKRYDGDSGAKAINASNENTDMKPQIADNQKMASRNYLRESIYLQMKMENFLKKLLRP